MKHKILQRSLLVWACLWLSSRLMAGQEGFTNSLGMVFVRIPAGEFLMGSPKEYAEAMAKKVTGDWYRDSAPSEWPQRRVRLSKPFQLGAYEVTLGQFRAFVSSTGYRTDAERDGLGAAGQRNGKWIGQAPEFNWRHLGYDRADHEPVVNVSWNDAQAFCAWLTTKEGVPYRLPTEAEWEYACRAGTATAWFWGGDESRRAEFAWSGDNSGGHPHAVGELKPNPWGLYDILGNVYEYCADGWSTNTAGALAHTEPRLPPRRGAEAVTFTDPRVPSGDASTQIVVRSTSWGTNPLHCRSAFRGSAPKNHRNQRDGFRVVREMDETGLR